MADERLHEAHEVFPPDMLADGVQDPYPGVLDLIGRALAWGVNTAHEPIASEEETAGIMNETEAAVLVAMAKVLRMAVLDQMDPASVGLIPDLGG